MLKSLKDILKRDKEAFTVPRSVQDAIPIKAIYDDGIFLVGKNKYSKTYRFSDINFAIASDDEKEDILQEYVSLLNSLDSSATTKITINKRRLNTEDFKKKVLLNMENDELDRYRSVYNDMLLDKVSSANYFVLEKYITVTVNKKSVDEARSFFIHIFSEISKHFSRLGSKLDEINANEKLHILHDFYRVGEENGYSFSVEQSKALGHSVKDFICPDSFDFDKADMTYLKFGNKYARTLFLKDIASSLDDDAINTFLSVDKSLVFSFDIAPVQHDQAVKEVENIALGVDTNITNWQMKQNEKNNFSATPPHKFQKQKAETEEFQNELVSFDQRMMYAIFTVTITADSKKELDIATDALKALGNEKACQFGVLTFQQLDGLNTALPIGVRRIDCFRTFLTKPLAIFTPFNVQEINHKNGVFYGQNIKSNNIILIDRTELMNGNSFILAVSGGGKSFAAKNEIINYILATDNDVIIIDPEREYSPLVKAFGGEIVYLSNSSDCRINALDINKNYDGEGKQPIKAKIDFIMSLFEQIVGTEGLDSKDKSLIDRAANRLYREYARNDYQGKAPTLKDLRNELLSMPEAKAQELALDLERYTDGSFDMFSQQTNVDTDNRLLCYDILDLEKSLETIGMLVVLDNIINRISRNRARGKQTYIIIDEIYLLLAQKYSATFLQILWKRARKYGACITGITQNVEDLLKNEIGSTMLSNSEFIVMLRQKGRDKLHLAQLLNIPDNQLEHITTADVGRGLLKVGNDLVPFINKFPKNELYNLMSTKPGEMQVN